MQLQRRQDEVRKVNKSVTKSKSGFLHVFNSVFFQFIPWNWKPLTNRKVQGKKVFWHFNKKAVLKIFLIFTGNIVLESIFKRVADLTRNFIKKRPRHRCFPVNTAKFLILFWKTPAKQLLFSFFNGSLLHGPKGLRSRFYDGVRLQGPSQRPIFLFLSRHLSFWRDPQLAFENLRRMPSISLLSFYNDYFSMF